LSVELECRGHDRSLWSRSFFSITSDISNLLVFKNGDIKIHRLLSLVIEPQEWGDFLHIVLLLCLKSIKTSSVKVFSEQAARQAYVKGAAASIFESGIASTVSSNAKTLRREYAVPVPLDK
jgi:hypothetical protein